MQNAYRSSSRTGLSYVAALCLCTILASCKVGPDFHKPADDAPKTWVSPAAQIDEKAETDQTWWQHLNDPLLNELIVKANAGNPDIKIAEARILQARATRSSTSADLLPVVNTTGSAERQGNRLAFGAAPFDLTKPFNTFQAGFDASWELDLFGGKKRAVEAANADLRSVMAERDDTRVSLLAEVARTYVDIRQYQAQIIIINDTIGADSDTLKLVTQRYKAGLVAGLDATNARAQLETVQAQLPGYQSQLAQAEYSMDVLLGEKPGVTTAMLDTPHAIPVSDRALVLTAPARVIADRPDIRMAEQKLAAATAQQGVATASFFPDISLSGFFGLLNADSGHFLNAQSKSYDIAGSVVWPILNWQKLTSALHLANAQQQEALVTYQKAVLVALSDVEKSVTAYNKEEEHRAALEKVGTDDLQAVNVSRTRYEQGLSSYLEVLDAQRSYLTARSQLAASQGLATQNLIAVYKSLGGGWKTETTK